MDKSSDNWQGSAESVAYNPSRTWFVILLGISAVGFLVSVFVLWFIPTVGLMNIHPMLPYILGGALLALSIFILGGAVVISLAIIKGKRVFLTGRFRGLLVKFFLPVMVMVGGLFGISRIRIERAFLEVNNQMVRDLRRHFKPERLLILMPHCIQYDDCRIKVTRNVKNCVGCGKCEIADLIALSDEFGINLFVSTGGTVARRKVYEERPDAVIAVACERDLTSGVQDAYPLPVLAIVNKRPRGYCFETGVELNEIKQAITDLVG